MQLIWRELKDAMKPTLVSTDSVWMIVQRDWQWSVHHRVDEDSVYSLVTYCDTLQKAKQYAQAASKP